MTSFYGMMKLMENTPYQAPEDFGDSPTPEEDAQGMAQADFQQEPMGEMGAMAADFPALAKAAENDPAIADELKQLFAMMQQPGSPEQAPPPGPMGSPEGDTPFMRK